MSNAELNNYLVFWGYAPVVFDEKLNFWQHIKFTNTLTKDVGELPKKVKKSMRPMAVILYAISFAGVILQAADIMPGIPDRITFSVIVMGLVAATIMLWKQSNKEREENRKSLEVLVKDHRDELKDLVKDHRMQLKEINENMLMMVEANQKSIQDILIKMQKT